MNRNLSNSKILPAPKDEEVKDDNTTISAVLTTMPAGFLCIMAQHPMEDPIALQ